MQLSVVLLVPGFKLFHLMAHVTQIDAHSHTRRTNVRVLLLSKLASTEAPNTAPNWKDRDNDHSSHKRPRRLFALF
jgi:hypothetical protein